MLVSWYWLRDYLRLEMSAEELADRLMMTGLNLDDDGIQERRVDAAASDLVIDLEVTSNRPDCLGHFGVAREIAAAFGLELETPSTKFREKKPKVDERTSVEVTPEASAWCPQYRARVIEGVRVGPSPLWLQRRLLAVGSRPINNVVDITNYVLLESGQPLHAFDYQKLRENRIVVRNATAGEKFLAINGKEYELTADMGVIADAERPVALAGVMGGLDTEVGADTVDILLESAEFEPLPIRRASRALDLSSDSSYRFERRVDPAGIVWASDRACHLLQELAGGTVRDGAIHVGDDEYEPTKVPFRWDRVERLLGIEIGPKRMEEILTTLGFEVKRKGKKESVTVKVPTFRRDLTREVDLIEEIGRIHGYENLPSDRRIPLTVAPKRRHDRVLDVLRNALAGFGFCEAVTLSFVDRSACESIRPWTTAEPLAVSHSTRKRENLLRQSLLPSLMTSYRFNEARGNEGIALFEVAKIYLPTRDGHPHAEVGKSLETGPGHTRPRPESDHGATTALPDERLVVGLVRDAGFRKLRGEIEAVCQRLGLTLSLEPAEVVGLDPERSARFRLGDQDLGVIGHLAKSAADGLDLQSDPAVGEIDLGPLLAAAVLVPQAQPVPDQPGIVRDLAVVLDEDRRWADLEEAVRSAAGEYLERLEFLDLYRGKQIPKGKKSLALRLTFRAPDRTLTGAEIDDQVARIVGKIGTGLGGTLR